MEVAARQTSQETITNSRENISKQIRQNIAKSERKYLHWLLLEDFIKSDFSECTWWGALNAGTHGKNLKQNKIVFWIKILTMGGFAQRARRNVFASMLHNKCSLLDSYTERWRGAISISSGNSICYYFLPKLTLSLNHILWLKSFLVSNNCTNCSYFELVTFDKKACMPENQWAKRM